MAAKNGNKEKKNKWEHPPRSGITIRKVKNSRGKDAFGFSFLVTIPEKITGELRKRKQFMDSDDAELWAEEEAAGFQREGYDYQLLSDQERNEVAYLVPKLREQGISVSEAINFALERLRPVGGERTVGQVAEELIESKRKRFKRGDLRERSYRDFRHRVRRFTLIFEEEPVHKVGIDQIKDWLMDLELSPRTTQNYLAVISELFRYATQRQYVPISPIDHLTDTDRKELCGRQDQFKEPSILTPNEADRLLLAALDLSELNLLGAVALGLFCGIRTEELKRLSWGSVKDNEDHPVVTITGEIAKKRRIRNVDIPRNALAWLSHCNNRRGFVVTNKHTNDYQKRFQKLLQEAGFGTTDEKGKWKSDWPSNAMRHSFGTYHYALHANPLETSRLLGHKASDQVLFDHYRALATRADGDNYFSIMPPQNLGKVINLQ